MVAQERSGLLIGGGMILGFIMVIPLTFFLVFIVVVFGGFITALFGG